MTIVERPASRHGDRSTDAVSESRCGLPLGVRAVAEARRFAERVIAGWHLDGGHPDTDVTGVVALVVSELVTNAVLYGHGASSLLLRLSGDRITVEVADRSAVLPLTRPADDDAEIGRGMHIISAVTTDRGVRPDGTGKIVWCELAVPRT